MKLDLGAEWPFSWVAVSRAQVVGDKQKKRSNSAVREIRKSHSFNESVNIWCCLSVCKFLMNKNTYRKLI